LLLTATLGVASAQGVRSLGMGGVTLPGPWAAGLNPAYAAYPADAYGPGGGFDLPLGLINLALRPSVSPLYYFTDFATFKSNFDVLAFLDQVSRPYEFMINPPSSPDEIVLHVSADGVQITDGSGKPFQLGTYSGGKSGAAGLPLPRPFLLIPIPTGLSGLHVSLGAFTSAGGFGLNPSPALSRDLASGSLQPNTEYSFSLTGAASAGVNVNLDFATPLPAIPGFEGKVYLGGQLEGFYGLLYADAELTGTTTTDDHGAPGPVTYSNRLFYVYPGSGNGYGGRLDLGVALDYQSGTYGLGVRNLFGYESWSGVLHTNDGSGHSSDNSHTITRTAFDPAVYANGAYAQTLAGGDVVLYGADASYAAGAFSAHVGVEYQKSIFRLRGGLGYENGLKLGLGAGLKLPGVSFDTALTSHQAPFSGQMVFGLAASLGFNF